MKTTPTRQEQQTPRFRTTEQAFRSGQWPEGFQGDKARWWAEEQGWWRDGDWTDEGRRFFETRATKDCWFR